MALPSSPPWSALPAYAVVGATVLVPDWDAVGSASPSAPKVPAVIVRVISDAGVLGGLVDVHIVGRAYDPNGGFRPGVTLAPVPTQVVVDGVVVATTRRIDL